MIRLLIIVSALAIAGSAMAQDTFGLWRLIDGTYVNYIAVEEYTEPFTLYIGLHDASVFTVGGYEVGISTPPEVVVLEAGGPGGWTNFGDNTNHLVGYLTPLPTNSEPFTILGQLTCIGISIPSDPYNISYHGAVPPSIPGHDGPVIANGVNPDDLIACGYVDGSPEVFFFGIIVAVEQESWGGVKSLFD